ncbi:SCO1664 family protein [Solwaraspora sp. WMMB335]|uniref:SCO1664 family protein n=1 Tax=Solwaraspora sp. WMMB335 TaxID=3404118 RepID=UPI003B9315F7
MQPGERPAGERPVTSATDALRLLRTGTMEIEGRLVDASNATLRGVVAADGERVRCVYKPVRGERPLWDFPDGTLAGREVSAYLVAEALGWPLVPPTVLRDGPFGPGACQLWIDEPPDAVPLVDFVPAARVPVGWLPVAAARDETGEPYALAHADDPRLARMAVFDVLVNNADRKGSHVLTGPDGAVYGVDHGLCFHVDDKLRTVLWGWSGRPLPVGTEPALRQLADALAASTRDELAAWLTTAELAQLTARVEDLLAAGSFPQPPPQRNVLPWPPM